MITEGKLSEHVNLVIAIDSADIDTSDVTSSWYAAKDYKKFRAVMKSGNVSNTKIATLQIMQAQDSSGTGAKALSDLQTHTGSGAGTPANLEAEAEIDEMDAANGFDHIAVKVTSNHGSALTAAVALELGDPVYRPV